MTPHIDLDNSASSTSNDVSTPAPDVMLVSGGEKLASDYQIMICLKCYSIDCVSSDTDD